MMFINKLSESENEQKNIFFGGNYIGGISLTNAISTGKNIGEKIVKDVKKRKVFLILNDLKVLNI